MSHLKLNYSSAVKIDGNRYIVTASAAQDLTGSPNRKTIYEYDVRFVLDGDNCRIEKFHKKTTIGPYKSIGYGTSDSQSECFFD